MATIRRYSPGEEARILELFNSSFPGGIVRTQASWLWRYARHRYFDPDGVRVAEENGKIVGHIMGSVRRLLFRGQTATTVFGDDLCVLPEERGKGLGRMLLTRLMRFAEEKQAVLMSYAGKDNVAHKICTSLGYSTVDEFVIMRGVGGRTPGSSGAIEHNHVPQSRNGLVVRRCLQEDIGRVVDFLNAANREKIASPQLDRLEYEWRYLTYTNSSLNSVFLCEECGSVVGHVAVTSHPTSGEQQMVILSEPNGKIEGILDSLREPKAASVNAAVHDEDSVTYESFGFSPVARGVVIVKNYSDLDILGASKWYLVPENIFGEP